MQSNLELMGPPKPLPTFKIRASFARLASTAMASCDIRYYLNGILVEPRKQGGAYIVATNGHHLLAIIDPTASVSRACLFLPSRAILSVCPKVGSKGDDFTFLELTEFRGSPALLLTGRDKTGLHDKPLQLQVDGAIVEGERAYPDWRRVLPDFSKLQPGARGKANAQYLNAPFAAIAGDRYSLNAVERWQVPVDDPKYQNAIIQRLNERDDILHVVMPMRKDRGDLVWVSNFSMAKEAP